MQLASGEKLGENSQNARRNPTSTASESIRYNPVQIKYPSINPSNTHVEEI